MMVPCASKYDHRENKEATNKPAELPQLDHRAKHRDPVALRREYSGLHFFEVVS